MACNQGLPSVKNICGPQLNDMALATTSSKVKKVKNHATSTPYCIGKIFLTGFSANIFRYRRTFDQKLYASISKQLLYI